MQQPSFAYDSTQDRLPLIACVSAVTLLTLCLAALFGAPATGAEPSSVVELGSFSNASPPRVFGLSSDGSTTFGRSRVDDEQGFSIGDRAIRWDSTGVGFPLEPPASTSDADRPNGVPVSASANGQAIAGFADRFESNAYRGSAAMLWTIDGAAELGPLEADSQGRQFAEARGVSADGAVICGIARRFGPPPERASLGQDAVRWSASGEAFPLDSLGSVGAGQRFSWAIAISGDGSTIGGSARNYVAPLSSSDVPVLWAFDGPISPLPVSPARIFAKSGTVIALSFDGSRAFGTLDSDMHNDAIESAVAVLWKNGGAPIEIGPRDAFDDSSPYADVLVGCSASGIRAVGYAGRLAGPRGFVWTEGQGTIALGTLGADGTSLPRAISGDGSTIVGQATTGQVTEAFVWRDGQMRSLWTAIEAAGIDPAAEGWVSFDDAVACSSDGSVIVGWGTKSGSGTVCFRAKINDAPTVAAPTPTVVECKGGKNRVVLSATVNDANSADRLKVTWKVDGTLRRTFQDVLPGSVVKFGFDYDHGAHTVSIEATDGSLKALASTTVTVADTTAPSIVVTPDVVVPTDRGMASATNVRLSPPSVADLCDGDPRLTNDAPNVFPLGPTIVKWRAEDADGNVAVATQRVTVVDREKPRIQGPPNVVVRCDRGQTFATLQLPPAKATDNVPQGLKVTSGVRARYPIGVSTAVWTATDAAGNRATWSTKVTVLNAPPVANAGKNVTVIAKTERGARVTLSGARSTDPDGHSLKYRWSAPGVRFAGPTKAKTTGNFPVGSRLVKLTVTDEAGAKTVASVRVTVKLKSAKRRPRGAASNAAFAAATGSEASSKGSSDAGRASGLLHAAAAHRLGIELGDYVRTEEGESEDAALLRYAERRELQRRHGELAARRFLASFVESGDEASLVAGLHAFRGVAYAAEDLLER